MEYLGKENITFTENEPILLQFCWTNLLDVSNLGLLIEICSLDDVAQATYALYGFYSGKQAESAEITLKLDTTGLMDASYRMRYTFFEKNTFGVGLTADYIPGLCFTKETANQGDTLLWQPKQWGYIQMPSPSIICIDRL